jgi:hypothetical protein
MFISRLLTNRSNKEYIVCHKNKYLIIGSKVQFLQLNKHLSVCYVNSKNIIFKAWIKIIQSKIDKKYQLTNKNFLSVTLLELVFIFILSVQFTVLVGFSSTKIKPLHLDYECYVLHSMYY